MTAAVAPAAGFFGKLPSRGDFVRAGLPSNFVSGWDAWCQAMMAATRAALEDRWEAAWLAAPVWRFALPQGGCGDGSALGVWIPSVDGVGRYFPLTIAVVSACPLSELTRQPSLFLDRAEQAGRDALSLHLDPADLAGRASDALRIEPGKEEAACVAAGWWTEGSPEVAPVAFDITGLPDATLFMHMLVDGEHAP